MKKIILASAAVIGFAGVASAGTIDDIKAAGKLKCGVSQGLPGFSSSDESGNYSGLDVDYCRAVAAAILSDANAVDFVELTAKDRFTALSSGEIDILSRNTTWTMTRDASLGLNFVGVTYYDGQGIMVPSDLGVSTATELDGAVICAQAGTTTELNITDYFNANGLTYELVTAETADEVNAAYNEGRCNVFTTDRSGLAAERLKFPNPDAHVVLPEVVSKEPLGPVVREGDEQFHDLARWVLNALIEAEEFGINQANVEEMKGSDNPGIQRMLGQNGEDYGQFVGVDAEFAARAIAAVGNYGEIYERNVGPDTPLKLARGVNNLWSNGGIMYAAPFR